MGQSSRPSPFAGTVLSMTVGTYWSEGSRHPPEEVVSISCVGISEFGLYHLHLWSGLEARTGGCGGT